MTTFPKVPGAAAIYLNREETTEDELHKWSVYARIKVLTEEGKRLGDIQLRYWNGVYEDSATGYTITDISGRTIHADGTVIPFTGKPYSKLIEKAGSGKVMAKVFTMPDVQVGSIIEYRYNLRYEDFLYFAPSWYIQSDLYTVKAHYLWKPTDKQLGSMDSREQVSTGVAWVSSLPAGAVVTRTQYVAASNLHTGPQNIFEVNVHDIPPEPEEEYMPPVHSFTYRVLFYYSYYQSQDEFWKGEGKYWSKKMDKFVTSSGSVAAAVAQLSAPGDTAEQKLKKIYAYVMELDNSSFSREHNSQEETSAGLKATRTVDDVLAKKRGGDDELALLFISMARAAGLKAYAMKVTDRDHNIFSAVLPSLDQLDDVIAIVNVDGKEQYFDPGERYCPYGQLHWKHTQATGIRQTDGGATAIAETPLPPYTQSLIQRIADLVMDKSGEVQGKVTMRWTGSPALNWRQIALRGDETALKRDLRREMEEMLPGGMQVTVDSIQNLENYEKALIATYTISGPLATVTQKRIFIPSELFQVNSKMLFPHEKRELPVYFQYGSRVLDGVRLQLPAGTTLEAPPKEQSFMLQQLAAFKTSNVITADSITMRRSLDLGNILFYPKEYPDLRDFYGKIAAADQQQLVLTQSTDTKAGAPAGN